MLGDNGDRKVPLTWREIGGPRVAAPQSKGFGSVLIEQGFANSGEAVLDFRPDGLRRSIELALS